MKPWQRLLICAGLLRAKRLEFQRDFPDIAIQLKTIETRMREEVVRQRDKSAHMNAMDRKRLAWLEGELTKPANQRRKGTELAVALRSSMPSHLRAGAAAGWPSESTISRARRKLTP